MRCHKQLFTALFLVAVFALQFSCGTTYQIEKKQAGYNKINSDSLPANAVIAQMIAPYKAKLDSQMNEVIARTETDLKKEQPEGTLNNLMAEAVLWYVSSQTDLKPDVSMQNYGGIRVPYINKGAITVGKIFELMPFDNMVEVVELRSAEMTELCNHIAAYGGWAVSSGLRFKIKNGKAEQITVNGEALDENKTYKLVTSDYLINGGDNCTMLQRAVKRTPLNYKIRDAVIDYLKYFGTINLQKDGRVSID